MRAPVPLEPESIGQAVQDHLHRRLAEAMSQDGAIRRPNRFAWCSDLFDYLTHGVEEMLAGMGITLEDPYPGPMNLLDEDQHADGCHVRRFWTVALRQGCPVAVLCTQFFHRHDRIDLPEPPHVVAFPPGRRTEREDITQ